LQGPNLLHEVNTNEKVILFALAPLKIKDKKRRHLDQDASLYYYQKIKLTPSG